MKRYAIMVRENIPGAVITELTQCDRKPAEIANAARAKINYVINSNGKRHRIRKYDHVSVIDLATGERIDR